MEFLTTRAEESVAVDRQIGRKRITKLRHKTLRKKSAVLDKLDRKRTEFANAIQRDKNI